MTRRPWLTTEERYLTENYGLLDAKLCAEKLDRTPIAITRKAFSMGLTSNKTYINGELKQILARLAA